MTITNKILDYVERRGSCTWTDINKFHTFGCRGIASEEATYNGITDRGGPLGYNLPKMCKPARGRNRFLQKGIEGNKSSLPGGDGRYRVRYAYHKLYDRLYDLNRLMTKHTKTVANWHDHKSMLNADIRACKNSFDFKIPKSSLITYNKLWVALNVVPF